MVVEHGEFALLHLCRSIDHACHMSALQAINPCGGYLFGGGQIGRQIVRKGKSLYWIWLSYLQSVHLMMHTNLFVLKAIEFSI